MRYQQAVTCDNASLDLSIRSFTVRGMLMEEDIVKGTAGPLEVIFVGLFGRFAMADQMALFSNCIAQAFATALVPDGCYNSRASSKGFPKPRRAVAAPRP
jgi:hypothetical protein